MSTRLVMLALAVILLLGVGVRKISGHWFDETLVQRKVVVQTVASEDVYIDKRFPVSPGENLKVGVAHADVTIKSAQVREAQVRVTVSGPNAEKTREYFERLNFTVEKSGETVIVKTDPRRDLRSNWGRIDVDVLITIPDMFNADLSVAHGDLELNRLKGAVRASVAHGDFVAGVLAGNSISIDMAHGDLEADELHAEKLRLNAAHGELNVGRIAASEFQANNAHGDIKIDSAEGRAEVSSAHGDISIRFARGLEGEFSNSHGDIELFGPSTAGADIDFAASDVELTGGHRFEGTQRRERWQGKINGGGPRLSAHTTHGSISLRAN